MSRETSLLLTFLAVLLLLTPQVAAFGAGNIASISKLEGHNWRHGDIEDTLKTVAFIKGHKWTSMMVKRVYFGNWLRDYSQAVDVGTLKGVPADTIRVLVWVLAFMAFGYATEEFEVTAERLGCYRPEEHIDNPKDYADNQDARQFDKRLRGPVDPIELAIDPNTGMKNYIANESGHWSTSLGYVKWSFLRSIHYGRQYTNGGDRGRKEDLYEALRCLGQGLHCLEDFGAHSNYTELVLREMGFDNVFPHVGTQTAIHLHGKRVFPLVTGTFGGVDFLHSVLGEATDHISQSEVDETEVQKLDAALGQAAALTGAGGGGGSRSFDGSSGGNSNMTDFTDVLSKIPGTRGLIEEAMQLQSSSAEQAAQIEQQGSSRAAAGGPAVNVDVQQVVTRIYPILAFRDKVMRSVDAFVSKIPGLEKIIDTISEKLTLFIMGLLAPFVKPLIAAASNALKEGSGSVVSSSQKQQFLVWNDPTSSDPTHSMLSKDHFSNILNPPAGEVASVILQYVVPRVLYAWDNTSASTDEIMHDISRVFHHPAARDMNCEVHRNMFHVVEQWVRKRSDGGRGLNDILSADSVKKGHNHQVQDFKQSLQPLEQQMMQMQAMSARAQAQTTRGGMDGQDDYGPQYGQNDPQPYGQPQQHHHHHQDPYNQQSYNQQSYNQDPYNQQGYNQGYSSHGHHNHSGGYDPNQNYNTYNY
ncbi:heterokaryon incompatibility Het-C [Piedraia hortae CBS 480.64]|uniref:Heterokaryon incompatibility Het-C n=1 Tax=Piedraia hortae CBS 480.64 TaxID=1314780 RepID=A0A6A7C0A2_9PEZI|nr:heterokaryon incompatibility Het-C [Piedraia hortae CBS 480.64]